MMLGNFRSNYFVDVAEVKGISIRHTMGIRDGQWTSSPWIWFPDYNDNSWSLSLLDPRPTQTVLFASETFRKITRPDDLVYRPQQCPCVGLADRTELILYVH